MRRLCVFALALACSDPAPPPAPVVEVLPREEPPPVAPAPYEAPREEPPPSPLEEDAPITIVRIDRAPTIDGDVGDWPAHLRPVPIDRDWRGERPVPETFLYFAWTEDALFVRFDCARGEGPLSVSHEPAGEVSDLYRFDVVELFVDPSPDTPDTYLEIELDPVEHYLDVEIDRSRRPRGDVAWSSGVTHASRVAPDRFVIEARIPAAAFGVARLGPAAWRGNVYRIDGTSPNRIFAARYPTGTERPNFHVPDRFGAITLR